MSAIGHKMAIGIAFAWSVREWSTVGGWNGLKNYFFTGKTDEQKPPTEAQSIK